MARFFKKRTENKGLPPGSLVFIGQKRIENPLIHLLEYSGARFEERILSFDSETLPEARFGKRWLNVVGLHDSALIGKIGQHFGLHPLALEDVMNTGQRAKFEEYEDHLFITLKMLQFDEASRQVKAEQLSILFAEDYLISFQEQEGDLFDNVRKRLEESRGQIRKRTCDYLAYALLDTVVDSYIYLIEFLGEQIDDLELKVLENPNKEVVNEINAYKRELHFVMKVLKPVKELMAAILRSRSSIIHHREVMPYYKDLHGLVLHAFETVETYRNLLSDYFNFYHASLSTKMNDIMRVLTIFSAIFIPLSFFAGVYGTNFKHFPELEYQYSYYIFWAFISLVAIAMLAYFKKKKWL